jgi:hypothetical protein
MVSYDVLILRLEAKLMFQNVECNVQYGLRENLIKHYFNQGNFAR